MHLCTIYLSALLWITVYSAPLSSKQTNTPRYNRFPGYVLSQGLYLSHQQEVDKPAEVEQRVIRNSPSLADTDLNLALDFASPEISVTVQGKARTESISVAMAPDMSTYATMQAAVSLYQHRNRGQSINPYSLSLRIYHEGNKRCAIISSIGGEYGSWIVLVRDRNEQVLHEDICIPRRSQLIMRPGYTILIKPQLPTN